MVGLQDGRVFIRSAGTFILLGIVTLEPTPARQPEKARAMWALLDLGDSHFAAAGDSGFLFILRLNQSLNEPPG